MGAFDSGSRTTLTGTFGCALARRHKTDELEGMSDAHAELFEQLSANVSGLSHYDAFREHRERLTALVCENLPDHSQPTLCVLGAGNCNDLDLSRLSQHFTEIHLVDIDPGALNRAWARADANTQTRLVRHAPVDLSGMLEKIDRWNSFQVTPEELMEHAASTALAIRTRVGKSFDVVVSACVLTQMQLAVVNVLTDTHRLFEAVRFTLSLSHLRTLSALLAPGGRGLLVTDVTADPIYPLANVDPSEDLRALVDELVSKGQIFQVAHPGILRELADQDPELHRDVTFSKALLDAWLWKNGPNRLFLVYALELRRGSA